MTGARVTIEADDAALSAALGRAAADIVRPADLMDAVGAVAEEGTQRRFETASDPAGRPWIPSERARLGTRGGPTLTDTGLLQLSIARRASDREVAVGTNLVYGAIHQFGGTIRAKDAEALHFTTAGGEHVTAKSVSIPARPFLGLDDEDRTGILALVRRWLGDLFDG